MSGPTNPTEEHFDKGQWGYDGTLWRKLNLTWGYNDRWLEQVVVAPAPAGWNFLETAAVPAGYVYVAHVVVGVDQITNPAEILFGINVGGSRYYFNRQPAPGVNVYAFWTANQVFKSTDKGVVAIGGVVLNDSLVAQWWGYKMKVA